jgi:DNA-binding GntR family transcriptional regulator
VAPSSPAGRAKQKTVLRHLSLPESVHEILRARILNNEIPAGAPLLEVALAEEFGVSRTTVRAAMRELQAERLIEITPRRGTTVIRMSETDAREVCFARYTLEAVALKGLTLGQRRDLAERMGEVLQVMELCAAKGDLAGMVEADTDLHRVIVEASGHPLIVDLWASLNGQMGALMRSSLDRQRIELSETVRRHAELIASLQDQPASKGAAVLRDHYINADGSEGEH